jgi:hypothetical protein
MHLQLQVLKYCSSHTKLKGARKSDLSENLDPASKLLEPACEPTHRYTCTTGYVLPAHSTLISGKQTDDHASSDTGDRSHSAPHCSAGDAQVPAQPQPTRIKLAGGSAASAGAAARAHHTATSTHASAYKSACKRATSPNLDHDVARRLVRCRAPPRAMPPRARVRRH